MRCLQQRGGRIASAAGLTLVELMVVVAIVSILAAIAYPSYRQQVIRTHRADAKAALLDTQQRLEKCFTRLHTYTGCDATDYTIERYSIDISALDQTFIVTAAPRGSQIDDLACGTLSVDQRGRKDKTGSATVAECWQK